MSGFKPETRRITDEDINGRMGPDPNQRRFTQEELDALSKKENDARRAGVPAGVEIGLHQTVEFINWPDKNLGSRLTTSSLAGPTDDFGDPWPET
ncbi:MAG TPA: hypothetical protein VN924_26100 [Bryobacteraceae bacterium]|nr:hypothetical protein [Bryobacteraceae bacterium]